MGVAEDLITGREAVEGRAWGTAYGVLRAMDPAELAPEDLHRLATAAYMVGDPETTTAALERAFHAHVAAGQRVGAARDAHWLALVFSSNGNPVVGGGWVARGMRLLEDEPDATAERGCLLMHTMFPHIFAGDFAAALDVATKVWELGQQSGEADLLAFGLSSRGRLLISLGEVAQGLALLDEAMVAVAADEVSPILTGEILCSVIEACQEISDYHRIAAWTGRLTRWCDSQPDLVPFTGQCAVHRAQVCRARGDFPGALAELELARARYAANGLPPATGLALYELGEVLRIQGDLDGSEAAYDEALGHGHPAQPGRSLLWLARGRTTAAATSLHRLLDEAKDPVSRAAVLPAAVVVLLAAGEGEAARAACAELAELARVFGCEAVDARAAHAAGIVALAEGDAAAALPQLRRAWRTWIDLGDRYEAALVRTRIALAFRALGDEESAQSELAVAERAFAELGAVPAAREAARLRSVSLPDGLTAREVEVLRLVASGQSNPQIAAALFLSEKTVARHLSNIFTKTRVTSRTAAATYAHHHSLT